MSITVGWLIIFSLKYLLDSYSHQQFLTMRLHFYFSFSYVLFHSFYGPVLVCVCVGVCVCVASMCLIYIGNTMFPLILFILSVVVFIQVVCVFYNAVGKVSLSLSILSENDFLCWHVPKPYFCLRQYWANVICKEPKRKHF